MLSLRPLTPFISRPTVRDPIRMIVAIIVVATSIGCWDVAIPPGARIGCVDDSECPQGFECREALGLCVELRPDDAVVPTIATSSVAPEVARIGTTLTARLESNEPLLQNPVISLVGTAGPRPFDVVTADVDGEGRRYTATVVVNVERAVQARSYTEVVSGHAGLPGGSAAGRVAQSADE